MIAGPVTRREGARPYRNKPGIAATGARRMDALVQSGVGGLGERLGSLREFGLAYRVVMALVGVHQTAELRLHDHVAEADDDRGRVGDRAADVEDLHGGERGVAGAG